MLKYSFISSPSESQPRTTRLTQTIAMQTVYLHIQALPDFAIFFTQGYFYLFIMLSYCLDDCSEHCQAVFFRIS
jgi:hypothetical protein